VTCSFCGAPLLAAAKFCVQCGNAVRAPSEAPMPLVQRGSRAPAGRPTFDDDVGLGRAPALVPMPPEVTARVRSEVDLPLPPLEELTSVAPAPKSTPPPRRASPLALPVAAQSEGPALFDVTSRRSQPPPAREVPLGPGGSVGESAAGDPSVGGPTVGGPTVGAPTVPSAVDGAGSVEHAVGAAGGEGSADARLASALTMPAPPSEREPAWSPLSAPVGGALSSPAADGPMPSMHPGRTSDPALDDIDDGFDAFFEEMPVPTAPSAASAESDLAAALGLFRELVREHARPVRDFMLELGWGDPSSSWLDVCIPALGSIRRSAEQLEQVELAFAIQGFVAACEEVQAACPATLAGESKARLLVAYEPLAATLPSAFALEGERGVREPVIVQSLLLQVRDVRKVTLDKLYAAGLTSLAMFFAAKPGDIATTAGIPIELATRIVDRFRSYEAEVGSWVPDEERSVERRQLAQLVRELRAQHEEHERRAQRWGRDDQARKKQLQQARGETLLRIQVLLAHLGEVGLLRDVERVAFQKKLELLERYVEGGQP
jgi:hypothetical protein